MNKSFSAEKFESQKLPFKVKRLSPSIGAELLEIDLREDLNQSTLDMIYKALLTYKVIFFRDQMISTEEHLNFARNFGSLEIHPFAPQKENFPEVLKITHDKDNRGKENTWHSDVTWRQEPSLGSVLRMIECPDYGGDTLFADMGAAYEDLPDEVKEKLDGAVAIHDFANFRKGLVKAGKTEEEIEAVNKKFPNPEHPVIRTHPDTKQKSIYVNRIQMNLRKCSTFFIPEHPFLSISVDLFGSQTQLHFGIIEHANITLLPTIGLMSEKLRE